MSELVYPLTGVDPADVLQGGYGYLDDAAGDVFHPGVDLNQPGGPHVDRGAPVVSPCDGVVRYAGYHVTGTGRGFGWHVWIEADPATTPGGWVHLCHLQDAPLVTAGSAVVRGQPVGTCGSTAGWPYEHTHFEVRVAAPPEGAPGTPNWGYWPSGQSRDAVARQYVDPLAWLERIAEQAATQEAEMAQVRELQAELDQAQGVAATLQEQLDAVREMLAQADSTIGALSHDVIPPLEDELAALKAQTDPAATDALKAHVADLEHTIQAAQSILAAAGPAPAT